MSNEHEGTPAKKRHIIPQESREIIWNVYNYVKQNKLQGSNILDTVVKATGVSKSTIARIIREGNAIESGASSTFMSPRQQVTKSSLKSTVDNFAEAAIRRIIYNFHITEKQRPTVKTIFNKIKDDESIGFIGKETSLRVLLRKMGFRWCKTSDNRKLLLEQNNIRELRCKYIRAITKYRIEGRPIIYTDETYIHSTHTAPYGWDDNTNQGLKYPISKGKRLIIVHAGGETGFVDNALLIFKSGQKTGDYHDEMNFVNYQKWLQERLIPNLPPRSVVVMDNASYHNVLAIKHPTSNSKKDEMMEWLNERCIIYESNLTKPELYRLIQIHKPTYVEYSVDALCAQYGHTVLRLPPYHPELNPIEKVWGIVKNWVASRNVTFKLEEVQRLTCEKVASVTAAEWFEVCRNVRQVENEYIEKEFIMDDYCENFVINLNEDSDDDSEDDEEC